MVARLRPPGSLHDTPPGRIWFDSRYYAHSICTCNNKKLKIHCDNFHWWKPLRNMSWEIIPFLNKLYGLYNNVVGECGDFTQRRLSDFLIENVDILLRRDWGLSYSHFTLWKPILGQEYKIERRGRFDIWKILTILRNLMEAITKPFHSFEVKTLNLEYVFLADSVENQ